MSSSKKREKLMVSNSQVKTTTSKSLYWRSLLLDRVLGIESLLGLALNLFAALLLVVLALHVLELAGEALDLVLVLVDLGLVHVQLGRHGLHLARLLLKVLLVDRQLLGHLGTWLTGQ